uniref:Uncharacterized protein n=1 Tax=Strongyloides stercoralis TaxID=6248 RepID=A0A0K0DT79_STRER
MFKTNKDIVAYKTSELRLRNNEIRREIEKQQFEIKNLEIFYQREYKRLLELKLNNELIENEIKSYRALNNKVIDNNENISVAVQEVTRTINHSINEGLLQSSTSTFPFYEEIFKNTKQQLDSTFDKLKFLMDDSSENKYIKEEEELLSELQVEQDAYKEMVDKLENAKTKISSRNPTGISENIWNTLIDEIKQSIFVEWYEFTEANINDGNKT